ncbi:hypothetical protein CDAR_601571 [Caerostris darwini]|uniref:Uncharacterized protein n=1 Tax=Caerostris darwini TaxID=1538125 RepID=A0AAV4N2T3_9ARAC|nr:hypothetical protein CDAR_601571 [Caerostris darwini]
MSDPFVFPYGAEIAKRRNRDCFPEESLAANRIKHKRALARRQFDFFGVSPSLKAVLEDRSVASVSPPITKKYKIGFP